MEKSIVEFWRKQTYETGEAIIHQAFWVSLHFS